MIADALRPHWLFDIANVKTAEKSRLNEWVGKGNYYFTAANGKGKASFVLQQGDSLLEVFAGEVARFSSAGLETSLQIAQVSASPRSLGWLVIKAYYSAFFAGHSLMRISGRSCTQLDAGQCNKANDIARVLGFDAHPLAAGAYGFLYLPKMGTLEGQRCGNNKGIHEYFWNEFATYLKEVAQSQLINSSMPTVDSQEAFIRLSALLDILRKDGLSGNWLSSIRNKVNYAQRFDTWFPYGQSRAYCNHLFRLYKNWQRLPDEIELDKHDDLQSFICACSFIVSLNLATIRDLAKRSKNGSFLKGSALRLLSEHKIA